MKNKGLIVLMLAFMGIMINLYGQEKYAILISGDRPDLTNYASPEEAKIWRGSWNDTYSYVGNVSR